MTRLAAVLALGLAACGGAGSGNAAAGGSAGSSSGGSGGTATGGSGGTTQFGGSGGTGATDASLPPCDADLGGSYFLALAMKVDPKKPLVFLVSIDATDKNGAPVTTWTLQPLAAADRQTPIGSPITWPAIDHAMDGTFVSDPPSMDVPGEANPLTGTPMTIDPLDLTGSLCGGASSCGTFGGEVTSPIQLSLTGSTWTAALVGGTGYPEPPPVDCAGTLADPIQVP